MRACVRVCLRIYSITPLVYLFFWCGYFSLPVVVVVSTRWVICVCVCEVGGVWNIRVLRGCLRWRKPSGKYKAANACIIYINILTCCLGAPRSMSYT